MEGRVIAIGFVVWTVSWTLSEAQPTCAATSQAQGMLSVVLYPYVPQAREVFFTFEAAHPGVKVALVEHYTDTQSHEPRRLSDDYYEGGLLQAEADIHEIDTILLADMVQAGKITPLELPQRDFLPEARSAVQMDGQTWGVPHWACGNFVFYEQGDAAIEQATSWQELVSALQTGGGLLVDFTGTSTLGEWYLTSVTGLDGGPQAVLEWLWSPELAPPAVEALRSLLQLCPAGYCRSREMHDRPGYYARMFAR